MKKHKHRYHLTYIDTKLTKNIFGSNDKNLEKVIFETDDLSELNDMVTLAKDTGCFFIEAVDTVSMKVLYVDNFDTLNFWSKRFYQHVNYTLYCYEILEDVLGNGLTIDDFRDPALVSRDKMRAENSDNEYSPCYWDFRRSEGDARSKYEKYLKDTWSNKKKKVLPNLVIYDNPHMTEIEVDARKKEDSDKKKLIEEKCGW